LAIFAALAAAAVLGVAVPLMALTRARTVSNVEAANPEMEQRLTTFQERASNADDPFLELLAADTLARHEYVTPSSLVPDNRLFALGGAGLGLPCRAAVDDRRWPRLPGIWSIPAVDGAEEECLSAVYDRCDAGQRDRAAEQRSADYRTH
jgi:hypothetical protein